MPQIEKNEPVQITVGYQTGKQYYNHRKWLKYHVLIYSSGRDVVHYSLKVQRFATMVLSLKTRKLLYNEIFHSTLLLCPVFDV
jgi:hypothetical protein